LGNALGATLFAHELAAAFSSFDEMVSGAEAILSDICYCRSPVQISTAANIVIAGISAERGPEIYTFSTKDEVPPMTTREEHEASPGYAAPFKLVKLPCDVLSPIPDEQTKLAAGFEGFDPDADAETVTWSLKRILEMQRRMPLPKDIGAIGGFGEMTTISADGITQRVIVRWPEDKIGAALHHGPADWPEWHRLNPRPVRVPHLRAV
jgi:hypothetical protein